MAKLVWGEKPLIKKAMETQTKRLEYAAAVSAALNIVQACVIIYLGVKLWL